MIAQDSAMLEKAFDILNRVYFGSALPKVMITIQSRPKVYGYITTQEVWKDEAASYYEINISAEHLDRPIENVLATLQHEMVHLYCMVNGIADTSKGGRYHNKLFKGKRIIIPRPQKTGGLNRGPQRLSYFSQHRQPASLHSMAKKHSDLPGLDFFRGMAIPSVPEADKHRAQGR